MAFKHVIPTHFDLDWPTENGKVSNTPGDLAINFDFVSDAPTPSSRKE
jgi:hypothetical protein